MSNLNGASKTTKCQKLKRTEEQTSSDFVASFAFEVLPSSLQTFVSTLRLVVALPFQVVGSGDSFGGSLFF